MKTRMETTIKIVMERWSDENEDAERLLEEESGCSDNAGDEQLEALITARRSSARTVERFSSSTSA
jgi:hypothetical protein